ncbi:MAG: hypothetical protein JWP47_641 [Polaromonas sp.]|nr:hypothetical protein [Polaromonas sp.]
MLRKLFFFAITSGLAAKAYRAYTSKKTLGTDLSRRRYGTGSESVTRSGS